ncbi:TetR/AcrR family transcriptional regulator [Paenibacillus chitinolyticus]|uniref:TetR/AcrR family transcriptional regulator n=1 Tax=Paenibacillus chitinolyticus TaxID=79263 RepID=UPI00366248A4
MKTTKRTSNRDKALNTAEHLFLTKGFLLTSMDEIVTESKVSKTNIYYHFKSKEELLGAITERLVGRYEELIREAGSRSGLTVPQKIAAIGDLLIRGEDDFLGGCPFLTLYVQTSREAGFVRERIGRFFREQTLYLEGLLTEGVRSGELRSSLEPGPAAALILSGIEGALFLQHASPDSTYMQQVLPALAQLLK